MSNKQLAIVPVYPNLQTLRGPGNQKQKQQKKKPPQKQQQRQQQMQAPRLRGPRQTRLNNTRQDLSQIGTVARTRLTRTGISDIRSLRICWTAGYTWVGDGTSGTANSVYFLTASDTFIIQGLTTNSSGLVPIAAGDTDIGQTFIADVEKHFARKVIKRMWIHVDSLQPSTANNMMTVFGFGRGGSGGAYSIPITKATASIVANSTANLSSMTGSFCVDSWQNACVEITQFVAGGSGARQNEFSIQSAPGSTSHSKIYPSSGNPPTIDDDSFPATFGVAGNSTTTALQNTKVHQISFEQEVDLLDYLGGMTAIAAAT